MSTNIFVVFVYRNVNSFCRLTAGTTFLSLPQDVLPAQDGLLLHSRTDQLDKTTSQPAATATSFTPGCVNGFLFKAKFFFYDLLFHCACRPPTHTLQGNNFLYTLFAQVFSWFSHLWFLQVVFDDLDTPSSQNEFSHQERPQAEQDYPCLGDGERVQRGGGSGRVAVSTTIPSQFCLLHSSLVDVAFLNSAF